VAESIPLRRKRGGRGSDDGRGIDFGKVVTESDGPRLIPSIQGISESEAMDLIFGQVFSTATR